MTKEFPMRALYCLLLICSLLPLSGCADLNISNPFETIVILRIISPIVFIFIQFGFIH